MLTILVQTHEGPREAQAWYVSNGLAVQKALYGKGYCVIHLASGTPMELRAFPTRRQARAYQQDLLALPIVWQQPAETIMGNPTTREMILDVHNQHC
jgi:hypothetical protein